MLRPAPWSLCPKRRMKAPFPSSLRLSASTRDGAYQPAWESWPSSFRINAEKIAPRGDAKQPTLWASVRRFSAASHSCSPACTSSTRRRLNAPSWHHVPRPFPANRRKPRRLYDSMFVRKSFRTSLGVLTAEQGRIPDYPCRGRLDRGSNELGIGRNDLWGALTIYIQKILMSALFYFQTAQ